MDIEFGNSQNRTNDIFNYIQKTLKRREKITNKDVENPYITLVYFFTLPYKKGIRIVNYSKEGTLENFVKINDVEKNGLSKKEGNFITKRTSPVYIEWDDDLNDMNKAKYIMKTIGDDSKKYLIYTFIVSENELKNIEEQINENVVSNDELISIKVDNLYNFDAEYNFFRELKSKKEEKIYDNLNDKNSFINDIEKEEIKLYNNISNVKKSKNSLLEFKKFLEKTFQKNKINKNK